GREWEGEQVSGVVGHGWKVCPGWIYPQWEERMGRGLGLGFGLGLGLGRGRGASPQFPRLQNPPLVARLSSPAVRRPPFVARRGNPPFNRRSTAVQPPWSPAVRNPAVPSYRNRTETRCAVPSSRSTSAQSRLMRSPAKPAPRVHGAAS